MAWILFTEQSDVTWDLTASGNPYDPTNTVVFSTSNSIVFPYGLYAQTESWTFSLSKPSRIAIASEASEVTTPAGMTIAGGISYGGITTPYADISGSVILQNGADPESWNAPIDSITDVTEVNYSPAFSYTGSGQLPNSYLFIIYIWSDAPEPEPVIVVKEEDRFIRIAYSLDGGRNWSNFRQISLGAQAAYQHRVMARNFGAHRRIVWKIQSSSPCRTDLLGAVANVTPTDG